MGRRASFVIRENGSDCYYYSRGAAGDLVSPIFYGLESALDFIQVQEDDRALLNEIWGEGAVLLDLDRRVLLFWGNDFLLDHVALIPHLLEMMRMTTWSGWDVRWASWGMLSLAEYLGLPISCVCEPLLTEAWTEEQRHYHLQWWLEFDDDYINTVITHRRLNGTIADYTTGHCVDKTLLLGGDLLSLLETRSTVSLPHERDVSACLYIDEVTKTLDAWWGYPLSETGIVRGIDRYWSGWNFHWHDQGYSGHIRKTGRAPDYVQLSREEAVGILLNQFA